MGQQTIKQIYKWNCQYPSQKVSYEPRENAHIAGTQELGSIPLTNSDGNRRHSTLRSHSTLKHPIQETHP